MNLAEYVAQFLKAQGVKHLFGLPGGENVAFLEAIRQAGMQFVLFHHEAAAGYAADVTGQLTDKPGVCLSTVGPGAANLVAGAAAATLERSPMLAITADIDSSWQSSVAHMKLDLTRLFGSVAKGSFHLSPESAGETLAHAWCLAQSPPRGAVHIALSPDVATSPMVIDKPVEVLTETSKNDVDLSQLRSYLAQAENLFIVAGLGVEAAGAQAELLALAEQRQALVAVTPKAKGHFPESHPLFVGCFTAYGDGPLREALAEADLILGVGLDSVDFVTSVWDIKTPVINLNLAGADDPALKPIIALDGDLRDVLRRLAAEPVGQAKSAAATEQKAAEIRQAIANQLVTPDLPPVPGTVRIREIIAALRKVLPEEGAVTVDVGAFKLVFLQQWKTDRPKSLFVANGLSAMGYAVPGALAIKLAQPDRPVVAVVGDGALLMYAGELATVARLGQPLVILVVVDQALALIRLKQLRQDVAYYGTEFGRTDFNELADAFGLNYYLVDGRDDPEEVFHQALRQEQPIIVEARINIAEYDRFR
jgi:acetolactate synthase-1/2/3 large subunit